MVNGIEAVTTATLGVALDAASLRQQVIASNIANANTLNYVAQHLRVEAQWSNPSVHNKAGGAADSWGGLMAIRAELEPVVDAQGVAQPVQLDAEVAALAQNSVHYQALIKGLSKHFAVLSSAVNEGRR